MPLYISKGSHSSIASKQNARVHLLTSAVARQKRQAMMIRQASCHGRKPAGGMRRGRWGLRVRGGGGGGVRLALLLRLRVRLSGVVGLLLRSVEELRCRPGGRACRWSSAPRAPVPAQCRHGRRHSEWDESSFYAEAIADCLEFIKSRSSYCPVNGGRV
ncbi:hypothetical protein C2845_PM10G16470 [Panicum miliaceum]|uniref:Uncharacterized protein n=1 Tax=Panicum miliaceum TaxID=4540 RepID=A0A3L6PE63_PANMI|nr:hypothetical protein C2845_PM10G16470 [Panicum miliaceum]